MATGSYALTGVHKSEDTFELYFLDHKTFLYLYTLDKKKDDKQGKGSTKRGENQGPIPVSFTKNFFYVERLYLYRYLE